MAPRFNLYVKASADGTERGSCPFSQRAFLALLHKVPRNQVQATPIDLANKPEAFLKMNPKGSVPVLVDHEEGDKMFPDSEDILKYLDSTFPENPLRTDYKGPAEEAIAEIFPKFVKMMCNKTPGVIQELRDDLLQELTKLEHYLQSDDARSIKFLLSNEPSALDYKIFPFLEQIKLAGKHWKNFDIPENFEGVRGFMANMEALPNWQTIKATDEEITMGWARHDVTQET